MDVIFERLPACELLDSTWSSLPDDLLFRILSERISFDAHGGVELSLLSRHIFDAIGRQALCGSIRIRDRLGLAQYLVAIRDDPQRADSLRNLYVCNRLDHSIESSSLRQLDPAPRYTSWDSSALEEAASETTLALATLYRTDVPAVGQGHQEAGTGGSNTHGLDWLRIRHPRGSANAAATTSNKDDGNQFEINEWTSAGLAYIFAKCSNLEFVHVWEPFTLGYPPELSNMEHLASYPVELMHSAFAQTQTNRQRQRQCIPQVRELTISSLAIQAAHFDRFLSCQPNPDGGGEVSALDALESLHLHWATLGGASGGEAGAAKASAAASLVRVGSTSLLPSVPTHDPGGSSNSSSQARRLDTAFFAHTRHSGASSTLAECLQTLPRLSHLRLTRPAPSGLVEGVALLLSSRHPLRITCELGWYMEQQTVDSLIAVAHEFHPRLVLVGKASHGENNSAAAAASGAGKWLQWDEASALRDFETRVFLRNVGR